ncbi:UNKNOWN [Stylonychia lemnae]|uniref:Methyltransferase n=1 Tax=Stylonychia lemnae TaxID=5949 RepID=A0A078AVP8_STYLE|nr:UNKNOWN [Stylonychia lemnae]|eukprot:CDW86259.1 UNKNOWN [Stylonychia lemnae]
MSYDNILTLSLQDHIEGVAGIFPIHGGILDLCGDPKEEELLIGIDNETGYARLLKVFLQLNKPFKYKSLKWVHAGATNLRYQKLKQEDFHLTFLNPPFSSQISKSKMPKIHELMSFGYQGVIANARKSWMEDEQNQQIIQYFKQIYFLTVNKMKSDAARTKQELMDFYQVTDKQAYEIFQRLWESDGLSLSEKFDEKALKDTEAIFSLDTKIEVPQERNWIQNL